MNNPPRPLHGTGHLATPRLFELSRGDAILAAEAEHLESCPTCRTALVAEQQVSVAARAALQLQASSASDGFVTATLARFEAAQALRETRQRLAAWLVVALVVGVLGPVVAPHLVPSFAALLTGAGVACGHLLALGRALLVVARHLPGLSMTIGGLGVAALCGSVLLVVHLSQPRLVAESTHA
jgi:hypothetical protein